jgi:hypothetical protein
MAKLLLTGRKRFFSIVRTTGETTISRFLPFLTSGSIWKDRQVKCAYPTILPHNACLFAEPWLLHPSCQVCVWTASTLGWRPRRVLFSGDEAVPMQTVLLSVQRPPSISTFRAKGTFLYFLWPSFPGLLYLPCKYPAAPDIPFIWLTPLPVPRRMQVMCL